MLALHRAESYRGKRGYDQGHTEALDDHSREERGPIRAVLRTRKGEQNEACRGGERGHHEWHLRPEAGADASREATEQEGHRHERQEHAARDEGRVRSEERRVGRERRRRGRKKQEKAKDYGRKVMA